MQQRKIRPDSFKKDAVREFALALSLLQKLFQFQKHFAQIALDHSLFDRELVARELREMGAPARDARRDYDCKTRCAGDTVLITAMSLTVQRETLARRSATLDPPAPQGVVRPRVAPPHTRPQHDMAPDALTSTRAGSAPG